MLFGLGVERCHFWGKNAMKAKKVNSAEDFRVYGSFKSLRSVLLQGKYADRLDKPLAYWALPSDRRLPMAFLGKTLEELMSTPFDELMDTPGVGQKKATSLITLLTRATKDPPLEDPVEQSSDGNGRRVSRAQRRSQGHEYNFNPLGVSEVLWANWRETVKRHKLGGEKLGHLAPTLQALPTVIWHTPLSEYVDLTLSDIRQLKTHGEKRVHAVLEVFYIVDAALAEADVQKHLEIRLAPKFVQPLENWIADRLAGAKPPTENQVRASIARPLLEQIEVDTGQMVAQLAADRLGMNGQPPSVRDQARHMGVTRARVYQLLEDCGKVMVVRWPEGKGQLALLGQSLQSGRTKEGLLDLYRMIVDLFYPKSGQTVPNLPHFKTFSVPSAVAN